METSCSELSPPPTLKAVDATTHPPTLQAVDATPPHTHTLQAVELHRLGHSVVSDVQRLERCQAMEIGQRAQAVLLNPQLAQPMELEERVRVNVTDAVTVQHQLLEEERRRSGADRSPSNRSLTR